MKRLVALFGVAGVTLIACGTGDAAGVTLQFALTGCYNPAVPRNGYSPQATGTNVIQGIVTITNHGSQPITYATGCTLGYKVINSDGAVISDVPASYVTSIPEGCAGGIYVDANASNYLPLGDVGWWFNAPSDPSYPSAAGGPNVAPGVYQVSVRFPHGQTNAATVAVCAGTGLSEPNQERYAECNSPCASDAVASLVNMSPTHCGPGLTCGSY